MAPKKLPKTYINQTHTSSKTKTRVTGGVRGKGRDKVRVESRKLGERPSALRFPNFGGSKRIAVICSLAACNSAFMSWARVQVRIRVMGYGLGYGLDFDFGCEAVECAT